MSCFEALQAIDHICADRIGEDAADTREAEEVLMEIWRIARLEWQHEEKQRRKPAELQR